MVSRRDILKSIGIIGLVTTTNAIAHKTSIAQAHSLVSTKREVIDDYRRWNGESLARITGDVQRVRAEPTTDSEVVTQLYRNEVVRVRKVVRGQQVFSNSDLWLETKYGYIYATLIQPMHYYLPSIPEPDLGEGRWGKLIVPTSEAFRRPDPYDAEVSVDLVFYDNIFRLTDLVTGTDGKSWYKVREIYQWIYIRATHIRLLPEEYFDPITPEIDPLDKHIVINLTEKRITAFEYDEPVWQHPCSPGINNGDTPEGRHHIFDKRISDRMVASLASDDPDFYNLPGVPFVCYFTLDGVGTHGTYWHNDFGRNRSHGCVNLPNEAARWLWRWTDPHPPVNDLFMRPELAVGGTRIEVVR